MPPPFPLFPPGAGSVPPGVVPEGPGCVVAPLPPEAPFPRISLTAARLLRSRALHLAVTGDAKRAVLAQVRSADDAMAHPVAALLHAPSATVQIHWSP